MALEIKMPALSPTMEEGTLSKWLIKVGDQVNSGDVMAEIETDKATMEFEAVDEGVVTEILVAEGTEGVKVGTVIAVLAEDGDSAKPAPKVETAPASNPVRAELVEALPSRTPEQERSPSTGSGRMEAVTHSSGDRIKASPLAKKIAGIEGIDLRAVTGSGPGGRIVKADLANAAKGESVLLRRQEPSPTASTSLLPAQAHGVAAKPAAPAAAPAATTDHPTPHELVKLSGMRKTIARRLTESKQQVPHIYLSVDVRLDALLKLRGELNASLAPRGVKLSVNDMLIKALGAALCQVPKCNVSFAGDTMLQFSRADISVAVSIPNGLITPIITDAGGKAISTVSTEMAMLAAKAKEGKLQPHEYQGGTASLSNMGMMGIKQFEAVINPPQGMILAIGAGEARPYVVEGALAIATVMTATGSFDHRAIDGADGAQLMKAFKELVEMPLGLVA